MNRLTVRLILQAVRLKVGRALLHLPAPWWLRRAGASSAALPGRVHPYLFTLGEQSGIAETLEQVPASGVVSIPQWFVGMSIELPEGGGSFIALTRFYQSAERAQRERDRCAKEHPAAAVFGIVLQFDPINAKERAQLIAIQRRALRGDR